ncbi:Bifocal, partial [Caligus rogercresseyi]
SSGVILLDSVIPNESTDDDVGRDEYDGLEDEEDISEEELKRPPSPCSIVFIGGNLISGKSSLRCSSINSDKK